MAYAAPMRRNKRHTGTVKQRGSGRRKAEPNQASFEVEIETAPSSNIDPRGGRDRRLLSLPLAGSVEPGSGGGARPSVGSGKEK
ncbi:hypothetical protein ACHAWF_014689 [Thalassiosira exigua]